MFELACASYRLLPEISILSPITGESAHKFADCFPKDVIEIKTINGAATAVVKNARKDTVSRECLRHPEFADKVLLSRVHDHFICTFSLAAAKFSSSNGNRWILWAHRRCSREFEDSRR